MVDALQSRRSRGDVEMPSVENVQVEQAREGQAEQGERPERERLAGEIGGGLLLLGLAVALGVVSRAIVPRRSGARRAAGRIVDVVWQRTGARRAVGQIAGVVSRRTSPRRVVGRIVGEAGGELGRGLLAGMFGTLAITIASTIDQLATEIAHARKEKRPPHLELEKAIVSPWSFSADVVGKVFGITAKDAEHQRQLSIMAHWGYGSMWGASLAALRALGLRGVPAIGAVLGGQLGAEMFVMPTFGLFSPPTKWGRRALVSSAYQHAIYAVAAGIAFEWLQGRTRRRLRLP
jgi:hypothetical protein